MKKRILWIVAIVIAAIAILLAVGFLLMPTPAEALLRYAPAAKKITAQIAKPNSDVKEKTLEQELGLSPKDALHLIEFIQEDVLKAPAKDICTMLSEAPHSRFFEKDSNFNDLMWEGVLIGREANQDPMFEHILQGLDFFRRYYQIPRLLYITQQELENDLDANPLKKLGKKAEVIRLSWSFSRAMQAPEAQLALEQHTKSLEPRGRLLKFLYDHPEFSTDPEFINWCRNPNPEAWTKLLALKGQK